MDEMVCLQGEHMNNVLPDLQQANENLSLSLKYKKNATQIKYALWGGTLVAVTVGGPFVIGLKATAVAAGGVIAGITGTGLYSIHIKFENLIWIEYILNKNNNILNMNILSGDGGGLKGVITIRLIKEIEERSGMPISKMFKFAMGSSISTILIAGLFFPSPKDHNEPLYTAKQILDIMVERGPKIFDTSLMGNISTLWGLRRPKYSHDELRKTIVEIVGDDAKYSELMQACLFPSKDTMSNKNLYIYNRTTKGHEMEELIDGRDVTLSDLLCGTTAAPYYFPSHTVTIEGQTYNLLDSGTVVNDTSEIAFLEAEDLFGLKKDEIYELSIGTGFVDNSYNSSTWGAIQWGVPISSLLIDSNSENQQYELSLMTDQSTYDRINPTIPSDINYMDQPQYIDQYIQITEQWIKDNSETLDKIVSKLKSRCS